MISYVAMVVAVDTCNESQHLAGVETSFVYLIPRSFDRAVYSIQRKLAIGVSLS